MKEYDNTIADFEALYDDILTLSDELDAIAVKEENVTTEDVDKIRVVKQIVDCVNDVPARVVEYYGKRYILDVDEK